MNIKTQSPLSKIVLITMLVFLVASCQPTPLPTQTPNGNDIQDIRVQATEPTRTTSKVEQFPLPNCGGSDKLAQSLGTFASVNKSATISGKASGAGGGEVGVSEIVKLKLEIQVELAYQKTFESANSRLDTIIMSAAAGTHVVYTIVWEEQTFDSFIQYSSNGEVYKAPYTYKLGVPKIDKSYNVACDGNNITTQEPVVIPPTITPTAIILNSPPSQTGRIFFHSDMNGNAGLYQYDFATNYLLRLANTSGSESFPSISPDGSRVCFETLANNHWQIFCTDSDGNNYVNLSNSTADEGMPRFSPDGRFIAFHRREKSNSFSQWQIWVMNSDGTHKRQLTFEDGYMGEPAWFPNGDKLVFDGDKPDRNILIINFDGSGLTVINDKPNEQRGPSVSPDGRYIYYDSSEGGIFQIYRMMINGSQQTPLTNGYLPSISPDGKWLIFSRNISANTTEIYTCETVNCTNLQYLEMALGKHEIFSWAIP